MWLVLQTNATSSAVLLDNVAYGTGGPFAITIWAKPGSLFGSNYEYIFSHNQTDPALSGVQPNQVNACPIALIEVET